jgi:hypothetical protein
LVFAMCIAAIAAAVSPGTDLLVPAAGRVGQWVTDLYLLNPGEAAADVRIHWLERGRANPDPPSVDLTLAAGQSRTLEDVLASAFGLDRGEGAMRLTADRPIVAYCRIFAANSAATMSGVTNSGATVSGPWGAGDDGATYGQGVAAIPVTFATARGASSHVIGIASTDDFRTNVYALAGPDGASLRLALLEPSGSETAATTLVLEELEPFLRRVDRLFKIPQLAEATLLIEVESGSAVVGASRIDKRSSDPMTLESWVDHDAVSAGAYYGAVLGAVSTGGMSLVVDAAGSMTGLEFTFPAAGCGVLFSTGQDLADDPVPLADLARGHVFSSSYPGGGSMTWQLVLAATSGPGLTGTLGATGSGWAGELAACNGDHDELAVTAGRQRP